jgi:DNA excision repair protein ERCC-2
MAIKAENNHISLSVRDLLSSPVKSFKTLSSFPLPQRGMLGKQAQIKSQQQKQKSFGLFHREYPVTGNFHINDYSITVNGRIDGVYEVNGRLEVEEIKSVILTASEFKNLNIDKYPEFSEQLLFYCYLLQREKDGIEIVPYLTLVNLVNDKSRHFDVLYNPLTIESLLFKRMQLIIQDIESEKQITDERTSQLSNIDFNLSESRPQQNTMMEKVTEILNDQKHLLASAPTGTGKTAASLIPAIKYAVTQNKKIFFATSKTTQQNIVRETLGPVFESELYFKTLFVKSAASMCANDVFFCHEDFCTYAKDYNQKLLQSNLLAEFDSNLIDPEIIFEKAKANMVCPSEVLFDLTPTADIIVGDYNYIFDPAVYLRRLFFKKEHSDWILIIDEAHNLYQRGMNYFSPEIKCKEIEAVKKLHKSRKTAIYKNIIRSLNDFINLFKDLRVEGETRYEHQQYYLPQLDIQSWQRAFNQFEPAFIKYLIHKVKRKIMMQDDPLETVYYKIRRFIQVAKFESDAFIPIFDAESGGILKIQCCDPSEQLGRQINAFHSVIAMSATLDPLPYYQKVLGFAEDQTEMMSLDSPFSSANRKMIIIPNISTKYKDRKNNYPKYAEIILNTVKQRKGNYLVFFPSFEFMQNVNLFLGNYKGEKILQTMGMPQEDRNEILYQLKETQKPKILLAVMGGIFSEGVDFYGDMCIGVILFSPGLPQINYERELIKEYYDKKTENGFEYAYLYPGLNKVIQSAGRLIRSAQDKGIVVLVGERFAEEQVNELLPDYWFQNPGDVVVTEKYEKEIKNFWESLQ